jgi:HK97 family phage major capsid protein
VPKIKEIIMSDVIDMKAVEVALSEKHNELKGLIEKSNAEVAEFGKVATDTKQGIDVISAKCTELGDRMHEIEQKGLGSQEHAESETFGEQFSKSDGWAAMQEGRQGSAKMSVKTAIVNATGQNQPLAPSDRRPGMIAEPNRILSIRDILPVGRTSSNLIEYAKENVFTNNAGPQYASPAFENVTKPESGITFTLASSAVVTIAHWIPASKQVLEDSPMLQSYIDGRLMYGLKLEEEDELLNGAGTSGKLNGLLNQATTQTLPSPAPTAVDQIRYAIAEASVSNYTPTAIVMNPNDWRDLELAKDTQGRYLFANPQSMANPMMWGLPVVVTNSIAENTFLLGAFGMGAQIWDRMDASIEVSRENSDNFVKNMCTILAEERLALTVYRPAAFLKGTI